MDTRQLKTFMYTMRPASATSIGEVNGMHLQLLGSARLTAALRVAPTGPFARLVCVVIALDELDEIINAP